MKLSNTNDDLCSIEFDYVFAESLLLLEDFVKLSSIDEWHDKVESCFGLEQIFHSAQEGMICFKQNVFLKGRRLDLVVLNEHIFANGLDGVLFACLGKESQVDSPECALAKLQLYIEIFKPNIRCVAFLSNRR